MGLGIWSLFAIAALLVWMLLKGGFENGTDRAPGPHVQDRHASNARSWLLAAFFGLGTASYTCVLAWLAPYYVERGWTEQSAGLILGFLTAMEVLSGLVTPAIASRSSDRRVVLIVLLLLIIFGFVGLALLPDTFSLLWPCMLGIGIGGLFPMSLIVSMDHIESPSRAGNLTAFVQGIGYLIAGVSPLLAGVIRDRLASFEWAWISLAAVMTLLVAMALRFNPAHYSRLYP
ncbi:cyanate transporter [compost metagenome]